MMKVAPLLLCLLVASAAAAPVRQLLQGADPAVLEAEIGKVLDEQGVTAEQAAVILAGEEVEPVSELPLVVTAPDNIPICINFVRAACCPAALDLTATKNSVVAPDTCEVEIPLRSGNPTLPFYRKHQPVVGVAVEDLAAALEAVKAAEVIQFTRVGDYVPFVWAAPGESYVCRCVLTPADWKALIAASKPEAEAVAVPAVVVEAAPEDAATEEALKEAPAFLAAADEAGDLATAGKTITSILG